MNRRDAILGMTAMAGMATFGGAARAAAPVLPDYNLPPEMQPKIVTTRPGFAPYEVHVDPGQYAVYWTLPDNQAIHYVAGIGKTELYTPGEYRVGAKKEWPSWTPTPGMLERQPELYGPHKDGMEGGLQNPLGSRALYLFKPGYGDTYLRIHGTNDPGTLQRRVSNGCARLINDQMIDLYNRVPVDTRVVMYPLPDSGSA
mgnify:CR=1 FL=1